MAFMRLPIDTLSGGVGRQAPSKRLLSEAENIDNCLVTVEKSIEKRPPLTKIVYSKNGLVNSSAYLNVVNATPITSWPANGGAGAPSFNTDNLYFHYLDIDGNNRYCIIVNRAGYQFDPMTTKKFTHTINGVAVTINLGNFISVFRIEPTEWIEEEVDISQGYVNNTSGFNRGIFEYLSFGNKSVTTSYKIANSTYQVSPTSIKDTFGSIDFDIGILLWNKLVPLDYLQNNANLEIVANNAWAASLTTNQFIHSGDTFNYKRAIGPSTLDPNYEDDITNQDVYWINTRDNIVIEVNSVTQEVDEIGQSVENFSVIPQYPSTEVQADVQDANGFRAWRSLHDYYDNPHLVPIADNAGNINFNTDEYHITSPLTKVDRDGATSYYGRGKVYLTRNSYLTFPTGYYRATRYLKNPYFERVRAENEKSVLDHRRFPICIYKDTVTDGKWRVKHMPLFPRRSGTNLSNPGPKALERKERIQSMAIWKNRLWIATDNTLIASRTGNYYDFWYNDVLNIVETDPIDIQASIGGYNKFSFMVPFQSIMFVASSGSVQFEVRGGSIDTGISPFNVELRPTSFYSTSKLVEPQKMGNNIFFMDAGRMYMYLSGSSFNDEYSTSMDLSTHCKGYLPEDFGAVTTNSSTNSILFVNENQKNHIYFFTLRSNGDKLIQNAFYRWILSSSDSVLSLKAYEKDLYVISKRPTGTVGQNKLVVYFASLESVPYTTPMVDWLALITPASMVYNFPNTTITLPYYDPEVKFVIKAPNSTWPTAETYEPLEVQSNQVGQTTVSGEIVTTVTVAGNYSTGNVYVGRAYEMNVELSQMVPRAPGNAGSVAEGVFNIKRATFKHFNTGNYDIVIERRGRVDNAVSFVPLDLSSKLYTLGELKLSTVGEHFVKVLSYSEACKIFIKCSYPTPCNISNIEIIGNFRYRNTGIE